MSKISERFEQEFGQHGLESVNLLLTQVADNIVLLRTMREEVGEALVYKWLWEESTKAATVLKTVILNLMQLLEVNSMESILSMVHLELLQCLHNIVMLNKDENEATEQVVHIFMILYVIGRGGGDTLIPISDEEQDDYYPDDLVLPEEIRLTVTSDGRFVVRKKGVNLA